MSSYRLVIFDLDGTILDSGDAHVDMFSRFWTQCPRATGPAVIRKNDGPTIYDVFKASGAERKDMQWIYEELDKFYPTARDIIETLRLLDDARSVLETIRRAGIRTALVSNSHAALVREILKTNRAQDLFDEVSGSTFARQDKEDRLRIVAQDAGVAVSDVLYVGDNESDGRIGRAAGMDTCIILSSIGWVKSAEVLMWEVRPTYMTYSLKKLLNIVL